MYSNELVCDILDYIDVNVNRKISIEDIALKFYYNRYYIMKLFKREIGISINNYINYIRIRNSLNEFYNSNYSITRIALNNGFYSLEYYSEIFTKIMGISPRIYLNYCKSRLLVSYEELDIISSNLVLVQDIVDKANKYRKNKKPKGIPVLKRSIFK